MILYEQVGLNREGPTSCLTSAQPMDETAKVLHLGGREKLIFFALQSEESPEISSLRVISPITTSGTTTTTTKKLEKNQRNYKVHSTFYNMGSKLGKPFGSVKPIWEQLQYPIWFPNQFYLIIFSCS